MSEVTAVDAAEVAEGGAVLRDVSDIDGHVDEVFGLPAGGSQRGDEVAGGDVEPLDDSAAANGCVGTLRGLTGWRRWS